MSPKPPPPRLQSVTVPAPMGGLNTVASGMSMPPDDCVVLRNMLPAEFGIRTRLGDRETATGLDGPARSLLPFHGSQLSKNRLFACTATGIYDVSSGAPVLGIAFADQGDNAGWGIGSISVNVSGGHFLLYCDEANGYHAYSEANDSWVKVVQAASAAWIKNTAYVAGGTPSRVSNGGLTYVCTQAGNSANVDGAGPTGAGIGIVDGGAQWAYEPSIGGVDPARLAFVLVWKHFTIFVERDTATGWILPLFQLYGTASAFAFGNKFKQGGDLRGLYSWTHDGGSGIDDSLVAISGGGDVVVYTGSNPFSAADFKQSGVWFGGGVPAGRHLATELGGELLLLSRTGLLAMSKLASGTLLRSTEYETFKIDNLFNRLMAATSGLRGWSVRCNPLDNSLFVFVPYAAGDTSTWQLVMSTVNKAWTIYTGLPTGPAAKTYEGLLYFGTLDGRVCANDGWLDGVKLDGTGGTGIDFALVSAFQNLGRPTQKRVQLLRPTFISEGAPPRYVVEARYNWNRTEPDMPAPVSAPGWDSAPWDGTLWADDQAAQQLVFGAQGMGTQVALAVRGSAVTRLTLVGIDVAFDEGGLL